MSTQVSSNFRGFVDTVFSAVVLILCASSAGIAQQLDATIGVAPDSNRAVIECRSAPSNRWSFRDSYAGIVGLGKRIERFVLFDDRGDEITARQLAPGHFESINPASHFRYEVSLQPPAKAFDSARVSWLTKERGLLMLADLLPVFSDDSSGKGVSVRFKLPDTYVVYSQEARESQNAFKVLETDRAVFAVGPRLRTSNLTEPGMSLSLVADGAWAFTDSEALEMIGSVLKAHRRLFGAMPAKRGTVVLFPFPQAAGASEWSAETRGSTVTLLIGKLPSKVGALAQLSTPLTHELFHLWVPNGLALDGDYDWFYEGFTIYRAARAAVSLDLLTLQEFLNALARAYDASHVQTNLLSLIEASRTRWTTGQSAVYSKGMVVAFIFDLRTRTRSRGKRSIDDAYRAIFQKHSLAASQISNGNDAAMKALSFEPAAEDFVRAFIRNPVAINLATELAPFGLQVETVGLRTRITVGDKLSKQQRDLLRELGYNDVVRSPRQ